MRTSVLPFGSKLALVCFACAAGLSLGACGDPADDPEMVDSPVAPGSSSSPTSTVPTPPPTPTQTTSTPPPPPVGGSGGMPPEPEPAAMEPVAPAPEPMPPGPTGDGAPIRTTTGPSYATTVGPIFDMKCTESCHEPGGILGGPDGFDEVQMDLTAAAGYMTLTSGMSTQATDMWLVGATPEESYLWHKLNDTQLTVGGAKAKMPISGELTAEELETIRAWIEGGASP